MDRLRPAHDLTVEAAVACIRGAGEAQDRRVGADGASVGGREVGKPGLAALMARSPEQRREHGRRGGLTSPGSARPNAMKAFGLTAEEFQAYGVVRAKGYSPEEAADIVIRSRRSERQGG